MVYLGENDFTFDGIEYIVQKRGVQSYAPQDTILPIHLNKTKFSVSAGGTLGNNTYKWYKGSTLLKTITGDSAYTPVATGNYHVVVTNVVAKDLTLYSDTFALATLPPQTLDSLALVDLYDSTGGPNWTNHTNRLTTAPISTWYGVLGDALICTHRRILSCQYS